MLMLMPAAMLMHYGVVLREESYLERRFGEAYRQYLAAVPRYGWPFPKP
jgi:protein-S-isoprenylcysteine O-methyltransferase Ste14